jgi:hypothetical protein
MPTAAFESYLIGGKCAGEIKPKACRISKLVLLKIFACPSGQQYPRFEAFIYKSKTCSMTLFEGVMRQPVDQRNGQGAEQESNLDDGLPHQHFFIVVSGVDEGLEQMDG